jgi:hypothetical protein
MLDRLQPEILVNIVDVGAFELEDLRTLELVNWVRISSRWLY